MKKGKLVILMIGLAVAGITGVNAQSKKEKIVMLTQRIDTLEKTLSAKNESITQLQIKLARIEGATDAHNEEIKRLENKADSLKEALITKNMTIESQATKITQLTTDNNELQALEKEWATKNEALTTELKTFKEKTGEAGVSPKDTKPAESPKEAAKPGNIQAGTSQEPVKN